MYTCMHALHNATVKAVWVLFYCICNTNTTLSAECPSGVTIIPDVGPYETGDALTCIADGYDPTYMWSGVFNGVPIATHTGSAYTLLEGDFEVICTATVDELMCSETLSSKEDSTTGTPPPGKYWIHLTTIGINDIVCELAWLYSMREMLISTIHMQWRRQGLALGGAQEKII